jgi:GPH family glycoside/pentoside/hexuronide:cation symporter
MTSDVIDIDELNTGKRREGSLGAIYWWMVKFGTAVAGLLSGLILTFVSFKSNAPTQTDETMFWLRIFFVGIPILGTLAAIWAMKDYDIDEAKALEVRDLLEKRKKPSVNKQSSSYLTGKLLSLSNSESLINKLVGTDLSSKSEVEIETLFSKQFNTGLNGLCFSPYIEGQKAGDILSAEQIRRRLEIIAPHTKWIRTFSCTEGNELIPEIAHQKSIKTVVGAWISNDKERNEKEINALIKLANAGLVDIAAVGNEVLHRGEISEAELIEYIKRVKNAIPNNIEVGYVDAYYQFIERPKLVDACDLILCNFYPFWEGAVIDYSASYLSNMLEVTKEVSKDKRIVITETGWPSIGEIIESAIPSRINAMKFFISSQEWAKSNNIELFHFSSFDESWKVIQEGKLGTSWGLWDKNEKFKFKK